MTTNTTVVSKNQLDLYKNNASAAIQLDRHFKLLTVATFALFLFGVCMHYNTLAITALGLGGVIGCLSGYADHNRKEKENALTRIQSIYNGQIQGNTNSEK